MSCQRRRMTEGGARPAAERPDFTATIGFDAPTRRAIPPNFRGLPKLSR